MAIEVTFGDDVSGDDFDAALLLVLGKKPGYVIQLTTENGEEDVVVDTATAYTLYFRAFAEDIQGPTGPLRSIDRHDIHAIKIY